MNKYEVMYILKSDVEDAARNELVDSWHAIITNDGGKIEKIDEIG